MRFLIILVILLFADPISAQENSKEFNKSFKIAKNKYEEGQYYQALKIFNQLYKQAPDQKELNFNMGLCNYYIKNYKKAEEHFFKSSSAANIELFRYRASIAHMNMEFKKALNYYNAYKLTLGSKDLSNDEINRLIQKTKYAEQALLDKRNVVVMNMGTTINGKYQEYRPLISADEKVLIFTSRRLKSKVDLMDVNGLPFEDIYMSVNSNNTWKAPFELKEGINSSTNDVGVGLSPDGQILFISRQSDDLKSNKIYESRMGLDEWENPIMLSSNINSEYKEKGTSITLDDKVLYFSSNRSGGYGGFDIYKVLRLPNGNWSKAINLGAVINTPYDDEAPFIHVDKKTLYFSSKGHQNMGGYDLFKSVYENGNWTTPENLKHPINTVQDDNSFVLSGSSKVGYFSSSRDGGYGGQDIYKVILKDQFIKDHVLKAAVYSKDGNIPVSARITMIENESKKVKGIYKNNNNTGNFIMLVDPEKTYNIIIESKDYQSYTAEFEFDINNQDKIEFHLLKKTQ